MLAVLPASVVFWSLLRPEPCLQAVKMTDLSDNPLHESLWELEVEDLHRHIYSLDDVGTGDKKNN